MATKSTQENFAKAVALIEAEIKNHEQIIADGGFQNRDGDWMPVNVERRNNQIAQLRAQLEKRKQQFGDLTGDSERIMVTMQAMYTTGGAGLRSVIREHVVDVPVLSRDEFDSLLAANPITERFRVGSAAGMPINGMWQEESTRYPGYAVAYEHAGHGFARPVAYSPLTSR